MSETRPNTVAIVDYGRGNLFSVKHACEQAGLVADITSRPAEILAAGAVVLPGVGAFGDAMATLSTLDLVGCLKDVAASGKILFGVCLGMQLLMSESREFGRHRGLGLIDGEVVRLPDVDAGGEPVKVPQVGWNRIGSPDPARSASRWPGTPLEGLAEGEYMYFVHSFYCRPSDPGVVLSTTRYGGAEFCSTLRSGNIFACQFHPERSSFQGIRVYRNLSTLITRFTREAQGV